MNFTVTFRPDLSYYKEAYSEMVKTKRLKKFEPVFAIIMIIVGAALFYFDKNAIGFFPILFSGIGVFELIKVYTAREKWISDRMKSPTIGQEIRLQFTDDLIIHTGPFSNGNLNWKGVKSIEQTEKGIIIKPGLGTVIYLPKTLFENKDQVDLIIGKGKK